MLYSGSVPQKETLTSIPCTCVRGCRWHCRVSSLPAQSCRGKILKLHLSLTLSLIHDQISPTAYQHLHCWIAMNTEEPVTPCPMLPFVSLQTLTLRSTYPKLNTIQQPASFLPQKLLDFGTESFGEEQISSSDHSKINPTFYKQQRNLY